jgi:hypothetical protein
MNTGWSVAAKDCCSQRARREWITITGPATPAVVLKNPPTAPASAVGSRPFHSGRRGRPNIVARARSTTPPTTTCSQAAGSSRTTSAAGTAPTAAAGAMIAKRRQSTWRQTESMMRKPETVVVALVTSTPVAGPRSSARVGATTRPTPVPETRCRTEPTRIERAATARSSTAPIVRHRAPPAGTDRRWTSPGTTVSLLS